MTINEYKRQRNLTNTEMAKIVDVSVGTIRNLLNGVSASKRVVSKLAELGIEHEIYCRERYKTQVTRPHKRRKKEEVLESFLKRYQLEAVRHYGNTIISKKYSVEAIVEEFKRFGLEVEVFEFCHSHSKTHYVIKNVDVLKKGEV